MIHATKQEGRPMEIPAEEHPLMSAAEDLISAIHSKDAAGVSKALEAAFQISDSQPDEDDSQTGEE